MTEREKMLAGELYDCGDQELLTQWHKAKNLILQYNGLQSEDLEGKERVLDQLLGGRGKNLWITPPFYVDYGNNIYFGNNCEVNMTVPFWMTMQLSSGTTPDWPNVQIDTAFHPTNATERFGESKPDGTFEFCKTRTAPVHIGDNVWIGGGAILLPGVKIGNNVVIGAGSVVKRIFRTMSLPLAIPVKSCGPMSNRQSRILFPQWGQRDVDQKKRPLLSSREKFTGEGAHIWPKSSK